MFRGYRIWLIALAFAVTLGVLFGGQYVIRRERVTRPLYRHFQDIPGVQGFRVEERKGISHLYIRLGPVDNLQEVYLELEKRALEIMDPGSFEMHLEDRRDGDLEEAYYRLHYYLQEALATGRFSTMAREVERETAGLDRHRLYVDQRYIFLQLHRGDKYLYAVVPRVPVNEVSGGGLVGGGR